MPVTEAQASPLAVVWRACPASDLQVLDFGDNAALYHRPSGQTHFLNAAALHILETLRSTPGDAGTIARTLSDDTGQPVAEADVAAHLQRLDDVGLVSRQ